MGISAKEVANLVSCLGTLEGVRRVSGEVTRLNTSLVDPMNGYSRAELDQITVALNSLACAIHQMGRVVHEFVPKTGVGVIDYAG